jgi:L-threonylcarbamoyladenylate synthase
VGLESTIVDMSGKKPVILRPGMISREMIAAVLGVDVPIVEKNKTTKIKAPGMHDLHYAPLTKTTVVESNALSDFLAALQTDELPVIIVMHSDLVLPHKDHVFYVQMPRDAALYAHDLYRTLRSLDHEHYKRIVIEAVPEGMAWEAIRDRLFKASGSQRVEQ